MFDVEDIEEEEGEIPVGDVAEDPLRSEHEEDDPKQQDPVAPQDQPPRVHYVCTNIQLASTYFHSHEHYC